MATLEALKALAKKVCSAATDTALAPLDTVDKVIEYMAANFDGGAAAANLNAKQGTAQTFSVK